jgi:magnesium transporter
VPAPLTEANLNDPVTQHMRQDFTRLRADQTVGEALGRLRRHPPAGRIIYFYVVDADDRLLGVVPTRRLLLSPPEQRLADIMVRPVVALPAGATVLDACEFFIQHRFLGLPVVDDARHLLGVVDVELYTDEVSQLGHAGHRDDLFQLIGVHVAQAQQASPAVAFRLRFPWLLCNVAGGLLATLLSGVYRQELETVVALALFIPVVLALAESVSIQSVSLTLQTLRGEQASWSALGRKLRSEALTGLALGAAAGIIVAAVALVWIGGVGVALCLLGGIAGGLTGAAVVGLTLPILLRLLRLDPQVAAGPIALAAADVVTLLIYFNLARGLL